MAEETRPPEPPKIKLGLGNIKPPSGTPPVKPPTSAVNPPPKIRIQSAEKKSETARIDLSAALPPASEDLKEPSADQMADFYKKSTIRIDTPAEPGDSQKLDAAKRSTMRVDVQPPAGDTQRVKSETRNVGTTMRIDTANKSDTHRIQDVKKSTIRVDSGVEQKKKSETAKLEIPPSELNKRSTSKISISTETSKTETDDVFKKRTIPVSVPTTPPPAAAAKPPTISLPRPKTVTLRPIPGRPAPAPVAEAATISPAPDAAVTEAKKSETARLDLPPDTGEERPTTRPKTIRIKRPDGTTGRKALTIARPTEEAVFTPAAAAELSSASADDGQPGAVWAIAALAAVLVAAVLVYVLAAQTIASSLPWPGRLL